MEHLQGGPRGPEVGLDPEQLLECVENELEELEREQPSWTMLEKLAVLYNVQHHLKKKMGIEEEQEREIGFGSRSGNMKSLQGGKSNSNSRQMRELADSMTREELANAIVGYGRSLSNNGSNGSYNRLYNELRRYSNNGENRR